MKGAKLPWIMVVKNYLRSIPCLTLKAILKTIKEPDKNEYYIDAIEFDDDPLLSKAERERQNPRGGNGIVKLIKRGDLLIAERDIILGLNIPSYE